MQYITLKNTKICAKERFNFSLQRQINQWIKEGKDEVENEIPVQTLPWIAIYLLKGSSSFDGTAWRTGASY